MNKKTISIAAICFLFNLYGISENNKTDLEKAKLIGKIKSVTESTFSVKKESGQTVKGNLASTIFMSYDLNGYCTEIMSSFSGGAYKTLYKRDENGNIVKTLMYESSGNLYQKTIMKNDTKGNCIQSDAYTSDGKLSSINFFNYDVKNNLTELLMCDPNAVIKNKANYVWDENKNIIEMIVKDKTGKLSSKTTNRYDQRNNIVNVTFEIPGIGSTTKSMFQNEYDSTGNLKRRITYINGEISGITEKEIEYY